MLRMTLNPEGTLNLAIDGESVNLTADELEQQISALAAMRARMQHSVPEEPAPIEEVVINPRYAIRADRLTKACLLRIRHAGLGWLNFELPSQEVLNMKDIWRVIAERLELDSEANSSDLPGNVPTNLH